MKQPKWYCLASVLFLMFTVISFAQVKKQSSPFEKYRNSSVNELELRKLQFQVESMRLSLQPTPMPIGLGIPHIIGETAEGKLVIQVDAYGSDLPQTVDARKVAMMEAVDRAMGGFSFAFYAPDSGMLSDEFFRKWCVVQFSDN